MAYLNKYVEGIEQLDFAKDETCTYEFAYVDSENVYSYEHTSTHFDAYEYPESYFYNVPPVFVLEIFEGEYQLRNTDGNHRVNSFKAYYNKAAVVIVRKKKEN